MNISIIVPAYNNEDTIGNVIDSLKKQVYRRGQYEIIVIDDHSRDRTAKIAEEKGLRVVLKEKNHGLAHSINKGIELSKHEIVVTLHGDTVPITEYWLEKLTAPLTGSEVGACCSLQHPPNLSNISFWEKLIWAKQQPHCALNNKADAYKKSVLLEIGLFDSETFRIAGEDEDIALRIKEAGYSIMETQAIVIHDHSFKGDTLSKIRGIFEKEFTFGKAGGALRRKNPSYVPGIYLFPEKKGLIYDGLFRCGICIGSTIPKINLVFIVSLVLLSMNGIKPTLQKNSNIITLIIYPLFNIIRYYIYSIGYIIGLITGKQR